MSQGRDDGNVGNKHDYTPPLFRKQEAEENEERGEQKDEVLCDVFVEYKPRVRGATVMKRQHKKKFGRERKKE